MHLCETVRRVAPPAKPALHCTALHCISYAQGKYMRGPGMLPPGSRLPLVTTLSQARVVDRNDCRGGREGVGA